MMSHGPPWIEFLPLGISMTKELKALRQGLDPFCLSEGLNKKLQREWDLARYPCQPPQEQKTAKPQPSGLSPEEREALEAISQALGITVYARTQRGGDLVAIGHG